MTQYIVDLLKTLQRQLTEVTHTLELITAPENADYVYIDTTRGGEDTHTSPIPPVDNNQSEDA